MSTTTVPLSDTSRRLLRDLTNRTGQTETEVLDNALDAYRRKLFFDRMNEGYAALRADPLAQAEFDAERKEWDATLADGLPGDEGWTEDGRCQSPGRDDG